MTNPTFRKTREVALERADHECAFCGVTDDQHRNDYGMGLDVHHIIPRSAGGTDKPNNLLAVCRGCHKTLEHSQGAALKQITETTVARSEQQEKQDELEKQISRLEAHNDELVERIHELERRNRDAAYYKAILHGLRANGEVVTEKFGHKSVVSADSERCVEAYNDWGSQIRRVNLELCGEDIERNIGRIKDRIDGINRRGYDD